MMHLGKNEATLIIKEFIKIILVKEEWYQNIKDEIKAIVLYGSVARGTNRPDSDIDILIFVPLAIEKKYTKGEYFYDYNGHEINIVLRSMERLRELAKEKNDEFQAKVFIGSEIIEEKDYEVRELINILRQPA